MPLETQFPGGEIGGSHESTHRRHRSRRWRLRTMLRRVLVLTLIGCALAACLIAYEGLALRRDLLQAQSQFDQALALADPMVADLSSFRDAQSVLQRSNDHLIAADAALASADSHASRLAPILRVSAHLPGWLGGCAEVPLLIAQARELSQAGLALGDGFSLLTTHLDSTDGDGPAGARLSEALTTAEPAFANALAAFERATVTRRAINVERLHGPLSVGAVALTPFDQRAAALGQNIVLLASLPAAARSVLGMDGARTYAILGQNSAELRPTGGFIGSMGIVTIDRGVITSELYQSSYFFDEPERGWGILPAPMQAHLGPGAMAVRDANWSPDFPSAARLIEAFLLRQQDIKIDGVIGFTSPAVGELLDAVGPLEIEGFAEPLTADNWYEAAERRIHFRDGERIHGITRKNSVESALQPILKVALSRIQSGSPEDMSNVLRALRRAIGQRDLLLYFHDAPAAGLARRFDADGHFAPPPSGDVVALVDANLSYSKVGPYIRQRLLYEVWISDRGVPVESRVTVEYENRLTPEEMADPTKRIDGAEWDTTTQRVEPRPGVYGTYARLFIPKNSRPLTLDAEGPPVLVSDELGFTSLERYYRVPAGERTRFSYAYQIPRDRNRRGEYRLRVMKQPGNTAVAVEVRLYLPAFLNGGADSPLTREGDTLVYRGSLSENLNLRLSFVDATTASR